MQTISNGDQSSLTLIKDRNPAALTRLFEESNPTLMGMAIKRGFSKEKAEELIHQSWETFFANLDQFEGRSQLRTFLCGILINKIREAHRSESRYVFEDDSEKVFDRSFSEEGWWSHEVESPEKILSNKQLGDSIRECLEGLNSQQREAFLLLEVEGEDSAEACNILGVTVTHLRVLLFRAKDKLKSCLEGHVTA